MAGLDNIKGYDEGGEVESGLPLTISNKGTISPAGKVVADPAATADLLKNMEAMIAERNDPWRSFQKSLERASAWAVPSLDGGKAQALAAVNKQQDEETQSTFKMREQLAAYKAAQSSAARNDARLANIMGGGGAGAAGASTAGGTPSIPADVKSRMSAAPDSATATAIYDEWLKGRVTESTKKEFSPAMADVVDVFNPLSGKIEQMTKAQAEQILSKNPTLYRGMSQQPVVAPSGDAAARVAGRESGSNPNVGYHDLTKGTAYGTYGITNAAYKDVQAANPKFQNRDITTLKPEEQTEAFNTYRGLAQNQLTKSGVEPTAQNLDLAHFLGPAGAANFIKTGTISPEAAAANGGMEKATQISKGILAGKQVPTSGTTGIEPAPKQAVSAGVAAPTTKAEYLEQEAERKLKAEEKIKTEEKGRAAELEAEGKTAAVRSDALREARDNVATNRSNAQKLIDLSTSNPKAFGVLQDTGLIAAAAKALEGGATVPGGSAKLSNVEEVALRLKKGVTKEDIRAAEEAARVFAELQLNAAKIVLKGQGAVSDNERKLVSEMTGSGRNSPETIKKFAQWYKARANYDEKMGNAYEDWKAENKNGQFKDFESSPQYKTIRADHSNEVEKLRQAQGGEKKKVTWSVKQ